MEISEYFTGLRATLFFILLFLFILGVFILVSGVKNLKKSKNIGVILIILGIIFSTAMLYFMMYVLVFGINY